MIYHSMTELIGNTPMLSLARFSAAKKLRTPIIAKLESFNPAGSAKDRVAVSMLDELEQSGRLQPGGTVIEPTSGNTGIGLACVGASRGYRIVIVMPDSMSVERRNLMLSYGAELVLTPGAQGMAGAIARAEELRQEIRGSVVAGQFDNPANPAAHRASTGPEIWRDTQGLVSAFVCTVGTGGTITGVGRFLKEQNPEIRVIAVEPAGSPVLSGGAPGPHKIQGIGAGFVPSVLDRDVYDEVLTVEDDEAIETARLLTRTEGLLVGISSGAAATAAARVAARPDYQSKCVVTLFPDSGERYLSVFSQY